MKLTPVLLTAAITLAGTSGPALAGTGAGRAGIISTVIGGVGGPARATTVSLHAPCNVTFGSGALYVADRTAVRKISPADGLTTPAGTGVTQGRSGDGGLATAADLFTCGTALDRSGNLLIADFVHYLVQVTPARTGTFYGQAMTAGHIYAVAGDGQRGYSGSGTPARDAMLSGPDNVTADSHGNLVIADSGFKSRGQQNGAEIQVVAAATGRFYGQAMTAGDIYTIAGSQQGEDATGNGGPAIAAGLGRFIGAVRLDAAGNVVFADASAARVRVVAEASGTFYGRPMVAGHIYSVAGDGRAGFAGDGGPATSAELRIPEGVALDAAGNLLIADTLNNRVRVVATRTGTFYGQPMTAGDIYTVAGDGTGGFAGDGGRATGAELNGPEGVAVDGTGNLVIADAFNDRVRLAPASAGTFYGQPMSAGDIYTIAGNGRSGYSGDGGPANRAELSSPTGLAVSTSGNVAVADIVSETVRVTAATTGTFYGRAMRAGDIYTIAGNGTFGYSGDGGPGPSAQLDEPWGLAVDRAGNVLIADVENSRIRAVAARTGTFYGQAMTAGDIYTVAGDGRSGFAGDGGPATRAELDTPWGAGVDGAGNLLIADGLNNRVRVVAARTGTFYGQPMTAGDIYTVAGNGTAGYSGDGGPALGAEFGFVAGVTVDGAGNLLIDDEFNGAVRVVAVSPGTFYGQRMTAGDIYTVAGNGTAGYSGDGGPATSAEMDGPQSTAVDGAGNLVIPDFFNNRVRVVAARTGVFYGVAMSAGDIYTVAGNGFPAYSGDGGPATRAGVWLPVAAGVDGANLLFTDGSSRVRMVTG